VDHIKVWFIKKEYNLVLSPNIIRVNKSWQMRCARHVVYMREEEK
jgi:hypothetical protein